MTFSKQKNCMISSSEDLTLKIWENNSKNNQPIQVIPSGHAIPINIDTSNNGLNLCVGYNGFEGTCLCGHKKTQIFIFVSNLLGVEKRHQMS